MKRKLKNIIEQCLKVDEQSRNCDKRLAQMVYRTILMAKYGDMRLTFSRLNELPPQSSIKRIRCMIQNDEKKYPPTDEHIAKLRGWDTKNWEKRIGKDMLFPVPV
jgi:hypothetical protein